MDFLLPAFAIGMVLLWFYTIFDVVRTNFKDANTKLLFLLLVLFGNLVGIIIYFILKPQFIDSHSKRFNPKFNERD